MQTTKLTFNVFTPFNQRFNDAIKALFLRRDSFLNHLIFSELEHLEKALRGKRNSEKAKRYINEGMDKKRTSTPLTVVINKSTANRLRRIVKEHNINRDAFINRLFLFMILKEAGLERLNIAPKIESNMIPGVTIDSASTSPFQHLKEAIDDPFFYIRTALQEDQEDLYLTNLSLITRMKRLGDKVDEKNMASYFYEKTIIYIDDSELPDAIKHDIEELMLLL
ncbi:hypothetical protein [Alteromonas sp. W364]|uniref:hypothetical protein n=1 Tax=Alteromonas sp. W364 TaxID=3075610 RepID=UPI002885576B|nr:hypothetical protein [Alteromonas sp. W364]MDT0628081.1 hypothetical protein [Alteromonas sp. W364]